MSGSLTLHGVSQPRIWSFVSGVGMMVASVLVNGRSAAPVETHSAREGGNSDEAATMPGWCKWIRTLSVAASHEFPPSTESSVNTSKKLSMW